MARERNTVEYFPFYVKDGKTLYILQKKYGLEGIGFFTQLFRYLSQIPGHWICIDDDIEKMRFFDYLQIDEKKCIDMLDLLSKSGKIDSELWNEWKIIASQDFLDSLDRVYSKRNSEKTNINSLKAYIKESGTFRHFPALSGKKSSQSKVKESKVKESKVVACDSKESLSSWKYLESLFIEKQEYDNWGKQRSHCQELYNRILKIYQDKLPDMTLEEFINKTISFFWYLKNNGKSIWKDQAFFPSTLNSERIWTMFLEEIKKRKQPTEEDYLRGLNDT